MYAELDVTVSTPLIFHALQGLYSGEGRVAFEDAFRRLSSSIEKGKSAKKGQQLSKSLYKLAQQCIKATKNKEGMVLLDH